MTDDSAEVPLHGGWVTDGAVRVGRTVRRPRGANADFVERLLGHLESVGFEEAPRYLGVDEQGRDILDYVDGRAPTDCADITWSDEQLVAAIGLLRRFHDATAGTQLAAPEEVVCHGDFGPWNLIWVDDRPISIIDFDNAEPGQRLDDLGYAVWKHLNLGLLPLDPHEQTRRIRLASTAYGADAGTDLVPAIDGAQGRMESLLRAATPSPQRDAAIDQLREERTWLHANDATLLAG